MAINYKSDILVVPAVSSLFNLKINDNQLVQTQGYSTEGVGANLYRYDAGSSATINGGFVLPGLGGTLSFSGTIFNGTAGTGRFIAVDQTVADVTKFGAIGDGSTNATSAIQRAINSNVSKVYTPRGDYIISSTLTIDGDAGVATMAISGEKSYLGGSVLKPTMTDGTACILINNLEYWKLEKLCISHNAGVISNYIGVSATGTSNRWSMNDVHVRLAATGYAIDGFIASATNCYATYCTNGFIGTTINGGVLDLNIEVCEVGLTLTSCYGLTVHGVIEGASTCVQAIKLDDCHDLTFSSVYLEFDSENINDCIDIGETTACYRINFRGGFLYHNANNAAGYLIRVRNSFDVLFDNFHVRATPVYRNIGVMAESTATRFRWQGRTTNCQIQDNSISTPNVVNLLKNHQLDQYIDNLGYSYTTSCTLTKESVSVTKYIKTGTEGIRITAGAGASLCRMGILLNPELLARVKGKTITFGAWIYVPVHSSFILPSYPTNTTLLAGAVQIVDSDGVNVTSASSSSTGFSIPGSWNFVMTSHTIQSDATEVQILVAAVLREIGSAVSNGDEFVVVDSVYLAEGNLSQYDLLRSPPLDYVDYFNNGNWTGGVTLPWNRSYSQRATLTGNVTSITQTLPSKAGTSQQLIVVQGGAGSYTISFPAAWKFNTGTAVQPSTAVGSTTIYTLYFDGTNNHILSVKKD